MVEGQLHDILVVSRRFEDKRMNLFTQEIRKNPEGLAFDQELDLLKELQKRNPPRHFLLSTWQCSCHPAAFLHPFESKAPLGL